jgi:hypothetical protein
MRAPSVSGVTKWQQRAALLFLAGAAQALLVLPGVAQDSSPRPRVDAHGVAHLPAVSVPASRFMSAESRGKFIGLFSNPAAHPAGTGVGEERERDERKNAPFGRPGWNVARIREVLRSAPGWAALTEL